MRKDLRVRHACRAVLLAMATILPVTNTAQGQVPAPGTGSAADEQWRREVEARMQRLEEENRELRKSLGQVEETQAAIQRDVATRGGPELRCGSEAGRRSDMDRAVARRQGCLFESLC